MRKFEIEFEEFRIEKITVDSYSTKMDPEIELHEEGGRLYMGVAWAGMRCTANCEIEDRDIDASFALLSRQIVALFRAVNITPPLFVLREVQ